MSLFVGTCVQVSSPCTAGSPKRGFAGGGIDNTLATNAGWFYHWGLDKPVAEYDANFVPMFWGDGSVTTANINKVLGYGDTTHVLGFNEPERSNQANMTVANAISRWQTLEAGFAGSGIKLVSPAVSDNGAGQQWLANFMNQADNLGLQVDAVAFHWYGVNNPNNPVGAANQFLNRVDSYHNTYNKPVWITEFAIHDWGGNYSDQAIREANQIFLENVIPGLEARNYVEGYSFYQWFSDAMLVEGPDKLPTIVGDAYIPSIGVGDTFDLAGQSQGDDRLYLKGGTVVNSGSVVNNAVRYLDAISGTSSLSGTSNWGITGEGTVQVRSGATLRKTGTNELLIRGKQVINNGILEVADGSLWLNRETTITGTGSMSLKPNGILTLGTTFDQGGIALAQPLDLRGGTIHSNAVQAGTHRMDNVGFLHATTTFKGDGHFTANGPLFAAAGAGSSGIVKQGSGELTLNAANTFQGTTTVADGKLTLGANGSIANSPTIEIESSATFDVTSRSNGYELQGQSLLLQGQVEGALQADDGSIITVTDSGSLITGDLSIADATLSIGGVGFNEMSPTPQSTTMNLQGNYTQNTEGLLQVDLLDPSQHDQLSVSDSAVLGGTLEVQAIQGFDADFGDLFTIVTADAGISGEFDSLVLPDLSPEKVFLIEYGETEVTLAVAGSPADFDLDGDVDGDDLSLWQTEFGTQAGGGFLEWQRELAMGPNATSYLQSVPEPHSLLCSLLFMSFILTQRQSSSLLHEAR
ncbi:MAG: glycosyl hydrolase [Lacipirellulaceae bacterium]